MSLPVIDQGARSGSCLTRNIPTSRGRSLCLSSTVLLLDVKISEHGTMLGTWRAREARSLRRIPRNILTSEVLPKLNTRSAARFAIASKEYSNFATRLGRKKIHLWRDMFEKQIEFAARKLASAFLTALARRRKALSRGEDMLGNDLLSRRVTSFTLPSGMHCRVFLGRSSHYSEPLGIMVIRWYAHTDNHDSDYGHSITLRIHSVWQPPLNSVIVLSHPTYSTASSNMYINNDEPKKPGEWLARSVAKEALRKYRAHPFMA